MTISAPRPIAASDDLSAFDSGVASLDNWLRRRALANQSGGASRTYVLCDDNRVIAFYALASGSISIGEASGRFRRNMPDPVPVAILARLAIDRAYQKHGLGRALIRDAAMRVTQAADIIGIRGMLAHAISEDAANFYLATGFERAPFEPLTLMATLKDLRAAL